MTAPDARKMAEEALAEIAAGDHGEYCGLRNGMLLAGGKTECYSDCPKRVAKEALESILSAGPEAPPPPRDAVREAAERLAAFDSSMQAPVLVRGVKALNCVDALRALLAALRGGAKGGA